MIVALVTDIENQRAPIVYECNHGRMPIVRYDPSWSDPNSSWWVKAKRAEAHIDELRLLVGAYRNSEPYSLTPEATDEAGSTAYRLRFSTPVPIEISAVVGDILNNLRGALENLAYEIARIGLGGSFVDEKQERAATFPICPTPDAFEKFFTERAKALTFTDQAKVALRQVQPFRNIELCGGPSLMAVSYEDMFLLSELSRLHKLWNIDKHRRLTVVAWEPDVFWWGSNGPTQRQLRRGDGTVEDGSVLFYVDGSDEGYGTEINVEYKLTLTDDPARTIGPNTAEDVTELMERLYDHIVKAVVFPQVFSLMS